MSSIQATLVRLEGGLRRQNPTLLEKLRPGATEEAFRSFLRELDIAVPDAFHEFYRWRDGGIDETAIWVDGAWPLPLEGILSVKKCMDELVDDGSFDEYLEDQWWSSRWVPFLYSDARSIVVDTKGIFGGPAGQVIEVAVHTPDRVILAASFEDWIDTYAELVCSGLLRIPCENRASRATKSQMKRS